MRHRIASLLLHPRFVPACFAIAFALRLIWVLGVHNAQVSDYIQYEYGARTIAEGKGYLWNFTGKPTAYYAIGYPLFLSVFYYALGASLVLAKSLQIAVSMALVWSIYKLGILTSDADSLAPRIALLLASILPPFVIYCSLTGSDLLGALLLSLSCIVAASAVARNKASSFIIAGLLLGAAAVVRPTFALFTVVAAAIVFLYAGRQRVMFSALLVLGASVMIAPIVIRNYVVFHRFILITENPKVNLLIGNNQGSTGGYVKVDFSGQNFRGVDFSDEIAWSDRSFDVAKQNISSNPSRFVALMPMRLVHLFAPDAEGFYLSLLGTGRNPHELHRWYVAMTLLLLPFYLLLWWAILRALYRSLRSRALPSFLDATGVALWIYLALVHLPFYGQARYNLPAVPMAIAMLSVILARSLKKRPAQEPVFASELPASVEL